MRVHVVDTRLTGATNQGRAIAGVIEQHASCVVTLTRVRLRRRFLRRIAAWARRRGLIGPTRLGMLARLLYSGLGAITERPDVVITVLGRSEYASLLLGGDGGAFTIHVGRPVYLAPATFDLIVLTDDRPCEGTDDRFVRLPIPPTPILRADVDAAARVQADRLRQVGPCWVLLIGGSGAGYTFEAVDWERIADGLGRLARRHGARLLVTTSPRTGQAAERSLERLLPRDLVHEAVWYGRRARPVVFDYLAAGSVVFCTEDSRSMIGDAIAAGRPVYTIRPQIADILPAHEDFVAAQEQARRIRRVAASDLCRLDVAGDCEHWFRFLDVCWSAPVVQALFASRRFKRLADGPASASRLDQ